MAAEDEFTGDPFEYLRKLIRDDMNALADGVSSGACDSFESYRESVGMMEGFARAERHLLDVVELLEKTA